MHRYGGRKLHTRQSLDRGWSQRPGKPGQKRQRYKCTLRPKQEWIPITVPPIIDLTTFHKAAEQGRDNQAFAPRNLKEQAYLLRKLVRCGRCGSTCSTNTSKQTYGGQVHTSHYNV